MVKTDQEFQESIAAILARGRERLAALPDPRCAWNPWRCKGGDVDHWPCNYLSRLRDCDTTAMRRAGLYYYPERDGFSGVWWICEPYERGACAC